MGQYDELKVELDAAVGRVLGSGQYIFGEELAAFEEAFAEYLGVQNVIGVNSGTDALAISLMTLPEPHELQGEVILPSLTAMPTATAVVMAGYRPVFVDVDEDYVLDRWQVQEAINSNTIAIIAVHLYGYPVDMVSLKETTDHFSIPVIEDCAQAHGASFAWQKVGSFGDLAAFSFYPTKNLGAYGDAGAIATNDTELADKCRQLRQYGWNTAKITHNGPGMNSRMDELQAAILNVKLPHLDEWNAIRIKQATYYNDHLQDLDELTLPNIAEPGHVFHQYVIRTRERSKLRQYLKQEGRIEAQIHYPLPLHKQPFYQFYDHYPMHQTETFCQEVLSLPIGPHVSASVIKRTAELVERFIRSI